MDNEPSTLRLLLILGAAIGAHDPALTTRCMSRRIFRPRISSETKRVSITGFMTNGLILTIDFSAVGFVLHELGVSLTTYLANASVIGLAVSFGSQGVAQDVITGLTVVFSDLLDLGDMVDLGGQEGLARPLAPADLEMPS